MKNRLSQLRKALCEERLDALLVSHSPNIWYLTDFPAEESWLLVTRSKAYYITDFRYILEAKKGVKGAVIKQYSRSLHETVNELCSAQKVRRLGFEENYTTVAQLRSLKRLCGKKRNIIATANLVEHFREIKDQTEMTKIKGALRVHEESYTYLKRIVRSGVTEKEIHAKLIQFIKTRKCGLSFEPIVASGPNSCLPHAKVTSRRFRNNDVVLIDWGVDFKGYKSDLTRMFFLGKISKLVRTVNDTVFYAQQKALLSIRPNVPIAQIDYQARNYLERQGLAKYFGHSLGHGVGLEIHEGPRVSGQTKDKLRPGMVVTIEPGVYLPNKFGIRIEDMVQVTEDGAKILSGHIY